MTRRRRRPRRALAAAALLAAALLAGYFLWLRDSSLVSVEETLVTGLTTAEAGEIRSSLKDAAAGMTTLNVDVAALERAVAGNPAVAGVETSVGLPHTLTIEVVERRPIATVEGPQGQRVPVAPDGTLLPDFGPENVPATLPASVPEVSGRVEDPAALTALAAVDAAPDSLTASIEAIEGDADAGLVAVMRAGPHVLLGDDSELEAKWAAVAAAIAEGGAADAGYLDVSLPERPAAGQ